MKFGKINKKEIIDAAIGALIVKATPTLLQKIAPKFVATSTTVQAIGGAVAYVAGMLLKKPMVGTVGLAVAVADIANDQLLMPAVDMIAPSSNSTMSANTRRGLSAYTSAPRNGQNYAYAYNN